MRWGSQTGMSPALAVAANRIVEQLCKDRLGINPSLPPINEFSIFERVEIADIEDFMRLARKEVRAKRAMGAMVGMAVADSVGGMFEFVPVGQKGSWFDPKTLKVVGEYNRFRLKPGQWTDDTALGLCIADSLLVCLDYDGGDIRIRIWNWWNRGYNNAFRLDKTRSSSVGLGGNIQLSLLVLHKKPLTPRFEGLGEDAGNGSVMRLAPVPIYFHTSIDLVMRVSAESSYTTHPGPFAADACAFLGFVIAHAITRTSNRETAAKFLDKCTKEYLARPEVEAQPALKRLLKSAEPTGSPERCWNWRDPAGPFILETLAARGKCYNGYPVTASYFGSYSLDGLAIALHSVYHTKSFMEAIARCVNFLGDADSTGAICGQIAGAFYGIDAIDSRLIERLRRWDAGEIPLRGALLYVLGSQLSEEAKASAYAKSACALAWDVRNTRKSADDENMNSDKAENLNTHLPNATVDNPSPVAKTAYDPASVDDMMRAPSVDVLRSIDGNGTSPTLEVPLRKNATTMAAAPGYPGPQSLPPLPASTPQGVHQPPASVLPLLPSGRRRSL